MVNERIQALAPDLTRVAPRSARAPLGPYRAIAARALDKCRAELAGRAGSYHYNCPLDCAFFDFTGIDAAEFKQFVATGASDGSGANLKGWASDGNGLDDRTGLRTGTLQGSAFRPRDNCPVRAVVPDIQAQLP